MSYGKFAMYNIGGAVLWIGSMLFGGYLFGNIPVVKENFGLVIIGIIIASIMPAVIEALRARGATRRAGAP